MERIEEILREFSLTEYEIKAFVTLLKTDTATAEQISEMGSIPLPRVYDTLVELKKKGFVLISKSRPKKFKAISPEKALQSLLKIKKDAFENNAKHLESNIENIKNFLPEIELNKKRDSNKEELFTLWSTERRINVVNLLNERLSNSKKEVYCFAGDLSWLSESIDTIKSALRRGVEIKIVCREIENTKEFMANISKAKKLGLKIKAGYTSNLRGNIIDGVSVSLAVKTSDKGVNIPEDGIPKNDTVRRYELITIENSLIASALKENFEFWWSKLK
jgi:sugar-specific transcriptional regulator TrmB